MITISTTDFLRRHVEETIEGYALINDEQVKQIQAEPDWASQCHIKDMGFGKWKIWSAKTWRQSAEYREQLHGEIQVSHVAEKPKLKEAMEKYEKLRKAGLTKSQIKLLADDLDLLP